ncbi:MAG: SgcJ/EcaC family oxidoreductase [Acidobacteria bacterium]|nr:MAG: SgcJ/EcaC family oxidoreductase [Acidobacteriota bacterium]
MRKPLGLFSALVLTVSLFAVFTLAKANDVKQVREAVTGFSKAWNHHDMEKFGKLFAMDADFVNVAGVWMKGRQEIQAHHAYSHGTIPVDTPVVGTSRVHYGIFRTSTMRFKEIHVRFLRKDVAVAHVNWELLGDTRTPKARHGVFTFVLTQQEGRWLIAAAQNTEIARSVK